MLSTGYDLEPVLRAVARTTAACLGWGTAVINLYRPAWDDFHTVVVEGNDAARDVLLGQCSVADDWTALLDDRFERRGAYLIRHGDFDWSQDRLTTYVPAARAPVDPGGWHPEDALFVPLRSSYGELLGILSVDEPADGRRPSDEQLDLLVGVSQHAALVLEHAQHAAAAERQRVAVDHLLGLTASLAERRTADEMLDAVCTGIRDALGFQKVGLARLQQSGVYALSASVGMSDEEMARLRSVPVESVAQLLDPSLETDGVILIGREDAEARVDPSLHDPSLTSRANGRGERAWDNHVLIVPLRDREGHLEGAVWVDDPADRLLPTGEILRALRAFANHAMSAIESARQLELMRHLAEHDPLTGLRNRRGLQEHIDAEIARTGQVAVVVLDLDNFKRVNDVLGYVQGDEALRRFAAVLGEAGGGLGARLGGEEFALVLPGCCEDEAMAVAERVRAAVSAAFLDFPWPVTTSAGVAVSGPAAKTASLVLRAATRAVFGAKRLGRDRCVAYHPEALDALLGSLEEDTGGEQLAAAMLLAETLDLRDVSTARHSQTVGRYAEGIARALGLTEDRVVRIRAAGVLHDIGKLGVADAILKKPGPLTDEEWAEMRRHPELGARILDHANLRDISGWVLAHHERVDGGGYPLGLAGDAIPLEARILAVADAYEAMTADRPYRPALGHDAAREELQAGSGTQFDRVVVDAFLRALAPRPRKRSRYDIARSG